MNTNMMHIYNVYDVLAKGVASVWLHNKVDINDHIGLDVDDVKTIVYTCRTPLIHMIMNKHTRPDQSPLCSVVDALLITQQQHSHSYTERQLASYHHMSQPSCHKLFYDTIDVLYEHLVPAFINSNNMAPSIQEQGLMHNVRLAIDCSHTPIRQPITNELRRRFFYKKSETNYAFKWLDACDMKGQIIYVSNVYAGSVHDITILRNSPLNNLINNQCKAVGDKGFIAAEFQHTIVTPAKKPRLGQLTQQQNNNNTIISSHRAIIENVHARIEQWKIIKDIWRSTHLYMHYHQRILHVVCAIANINMIKHHLRAQ
jgi:hypothetical protein